MDVQLLLDNLKEEVTCSVCQELFRDPKQLPCLHSLCLNCLNRLAATRALNRKIECPVCRRETAVPECGTFETLPSSFYLNSLLDVLAIKQCDTSKVSCGNCDKKSEGSSYCFDCGKFWCQQCLVGHSVLRDNQDHHTVALKDFQPKDFENLIERPGFCRKARHEKELLKYHCSTCEEAVCQMCVNVKHGRHELKELEVAFKEEESKNVALVQKAQRKVQEYEEGIGEIQERSHDIAQQVEVVKRNVCDFVQSLIISLHQRKQELITKVETEGRRSMERLELQKNEIQSEVTKIESAVQQIESVEQGRTRTEIRKKIQEVLDQERCLRPTENLCVTFSADHKILNTAAIGSLQITRTSSAQSEVFAGLETKFVVASMNEQGPGDVTVELKSRGGENRVANVKTEENENGSFLVTYLVKEPGQYDMFVMVNGRPAGRVPFDSVQVKPRAFKPVRSIGQEGTNAGGFRKPWGVAVNERDELAVADQQNNRIQIFNSDGELIRCFGKAGSGDGEFNKPRGVIWDGKGNIIVSDWRNHRIQVFSETGEFIRTFGKEGRLEGELYLPHGVAMDHHGNIIVSDSGNKRIQVFSPEGQFLFKLGSEGELSVPFSSIFYNNQYIVSDYRDQCVKIFDKEGHFLYKFGTKGEGEGQFNHPVGLAVDKSGHLLVCDLDNCRVQQFKLDGTFQGKFGWKGSALGQFIGPCSLAVLSDGRLVVSDFTNNRFQIFK